MAGRRSLVEASNTRHKILSRAADMASVEGLEGLTLGRLAAALGMSKAGVIGQFGNKLELQLATLDFAAEVFRSEVWRPAEHAPAGLPRLLAICGSWMDYAGRPAFPGGCFIAAASFEFDSRPGPVHDALAAYMRRWHAQLVEDAEIAVKAGDLPRAPTPTRSPSGSRRWRPACLRPVRSMAKSGPPSTLRSRCSDCSTSRRRRGNPWRAACSVRSLQTGVGGYGRGCCD